MLFRGSPQGQTLTWAPNPRPSQHPRQREPNPSRLGTLRTRQAFVCFLILRMYSYSYTSALAATYPPIFCVCIRILVGPCWRPDGSNGHTCRTPVQVATPRAFSCCCVCPNEHVHGHVQLHERERERSARAPV
jgi:hypothetical protein